LRPFALFNEFLLIKKKFLNCYLTFTCVSNWGVDYQAYCASRLMSHS
jgi:hypothetical protein